MKQPQFSLSEVTHQITAAARAADAEELSARFNELVEHHTHRLNMILRSVGICHPDLDDVRQIALERLWIALGKGPELESPVGWLTTLVKRVGLDQVRARKRSRVRCDSEGVEVASEKSGVHRIAELKGGVEAEREGAQVWERLHAAAQVYVERADQLRTRRGHQVLAWLLAGPLEQQPGEVASLLSARLDCPVSAQTVWKWKERGAALVAELGGTDSDRARGELMLRAAAARW